VKQLDIFDYNHLIYKKWLYKQIKEIDNNLSMSRQSMDKLFTHINSKFVKLKEIYEESTTFDPKPLKDGSRLVYMDGYK
jgi:hypothetical protein